MFRFLKESREKARKERIEALANSCQLELYKTLVQPLRERYDADIAGKIAGGLSNHIMQFGHKNEAHASNAKLLGLIQTELMHCHKYLDYKFQQSILGCIILLASAWQVPLDKFQNHIESLHALALFKLGADTPNVSRDLPSGDLTYMYELTTMK